MSVAGARVRAWRLPNENERRCLLLEDCAAAGAVEVDDRLPKENDLRTFPDVAGAAASGAAAVLLPKLRARRSLGVLEAVCTLSAGAGATTSAADVVGGGAASAAAMTCNRATGVAPTSAGSASSAATVSI